MKRPALLLVMAAPARAEGLIDFDLLFAQNAGKVVQGTDASGKPSRAIDLGNGVSVTCIGEPGASVCFGMDRSAEGAVGCSLMIYTDLLRTAQLCRPDYDPQRLGTLEAATDRTGTFAARKAVPPQDWTKLKAAYLAASPEPMDCAGATEPHGDVMHFLDVLTDPTRAGPDLGPDRPPVMNPCL